MLCMTPDHCSYLLFHVGLLVLFVAHLTRRTVRFPRSPRAKPAAQPPAAAQQQRPLERERREGSPMRTSRGGSPRAEGAPDGGSQCGAASWHRRAPSELPPEIAPPAPRADMVLTPPTVLHRRACVAVQSSRCESC